MARTNAASASFQTQNLRGFAHSLHRPALQRLLTAEPLLRRAVPILIVAFIAAVAVGAVVQITENRHEAIKDASKELALLSLVLGEDLARRGGDDTAATKAQATLREVLPALSTAGGRRLYITEAGGRILAAAPEAKAPATLLNVLGPGQADRSRRARA
jgi:two-component system cell cycle sensor histidine kinase PleC